jgi:hypothetical protein
LCGILDEKDNRIEELEYQFENSKRKLQKLKRKGVCEDSMISDQTDQALRNEQLMEQIEEMKEDVEYGKQRENKLMYFLFVLKELKMPIGEIF